MRILLIVVWSWSINKEQIKTKIETDVIQITHVLSTATENIISAELAFAKDEMQKSYECPKKYVKGLPEKIKKEVGTHARDFGIAVTAKKFRSILSLE